MTTENPTYKVPAENLSALVERFEKLNKRIARDIKRGALGASPLVLEVGKLFAEPQKAKYIDGVQYEMPDRVFAMVTLVAPKPPKAEGWEFVGALDVVEGVGTVLRVVPGAKVDEGELAKYRDSDGHQCDHCGMDRNRKTVFVLRRSS